MYILYYRPEYKKTIVTLFETKNKHECLNAILYQIDEGKLNIIQ